MLGLFYPAESYLGQSIADFQVTLVTANPGALTLTGANANLINTGAGIAYLDAQPGILLLLGSDADIRFLRLAFSRSTNTVAMGMPTEGVSMNKDIT